MEMIHIDSKKKGNGVSYTQILPIGKTIATLDGCEYNLHKFLQRMVRENSSSILFLPEDEDSFKLSRSYRASSKVNVDGGDEFDPDVGCDVAKENVMKKYHKDFDEGILNFMFELRSIEAALQLYCDKHDIDYDMLEIPEEIKLRKYANYYYI